MKLVLGLLVSLAISSAFALPARSPKDEVDIVQVPQGQQRSSGSESGSSNDSSNDSSKDSSNGSSNGSSNDSSNDNSDVEPDFKNFKGLVDTGAGYPFLAPLPRPFSFNLGFFDSFDDIFRGLRNRLWSVDSDGSSEEDGLSLGSSPINDTTSVVKVVDGHKIEINETVIGNGDSAGGAVFKFRIINIRPLESGEEVSEGPQTSASRSDDSSNSRSRDTESDSEESKSSDENEINANVDDPEITTEAITTEMLDTGMPSLDNNAIDTDSPVKRDELQEDTPTTTEGLDDSDVAATLSEDTPNPAGNTMKSEQLSELVDPENVNEEEIKSPAASSSTTSSDEEQETDVKDDSNDEINESIIVNQSAEDAVEELEELLEKRQELQEVIAEKQMQALVDSVGEKLSMADADEERFADEVEKMASTDNADEDETIAEATQKPYNQEKHSLREDVSSSDEEDDNDEKKDSENEKSDNIKNEGLESEWGGIASLDDKNILTNEIDVYESVPIDLSNDIAINDILAGQGAPINPHAELVDVEELTSGRGVGESRRLEILSDIK